MSGINNIISGITIFLKYLNTLDDGTKQTITNFVVLVAIIPVAALVFLTLMKAINSYTIFMAVASEATKSFTRSIVSLLGTIAILIAGIAMIAYSFGVFNNLGRTTKKTIDNTSNATKALNGLTSATNNNANSAQKASKANKELSDNLQSFDEISKLNLDSGNITDSSTSSPIVDLSGVDTGAFNNISDQFNTLNDKVQEFKERMENLKPVIGVIGSVLTLLGIKNFVKDVTKLVKKLPLLKSGLEGISNIGVITLAVTLGITLGKLYADNIDEISPGITKLFKEKYGDDYDEQSNIYKFGINLQYVIASMGTKLIDLIPGVTEEDAIKFLTGVGDVITNAVRLINIFDTDTFAKSWQGVWKNIKNIFKDTDVGNFFQAIYDILSNTFKLANVFDIETFKSSWQGVWDSIKNYFEDTGVGIFFDNIYSLINGQKWDDVWSIIKTSGENMWNNFSTWWSSTGVPDWWNNNVSPWFTWEKWNELSQNAKDGLTNKFNDFKDKFDPVKDWWNNKISPWFTWEKWKSLGQNAVDGIKSAFSNMNLSFKLPHFSWTSTPATGWITNVLSALNLPTSLPKLNVSWYEKGGVFGSDSVIGVGEYIGAKSNPEIVAPQSMIYDANIKAIQDSKINNRDIMSGSETITKKIQLELDLKSGGVKLGKQIADLILDADDFYELGLLK